jgi:hypothetical protein
MPSLQEEERNCSLLLTGAGSRAEVDKADQQRSSSGGSSLRQHGRDPAGGVTPAAKTLNAVAARALATTAAPNIDIRV